MRFSVKRFLIAVLPVFLAVLISACGSFDGVIENSKEDEIRIGFALPARDKYWASFEKAAKEYLNGMGIRYDFNIAKEDFSTQQSQVDSYRSQGYDAVVVGLTEPDAWSRVLESAGDMKVVFFNRRPDNKSAYDGEKAVYVGMSEYDAGRAQGEWLVKHFDEIGAPKELNGVMIMGIPEQINVSDRTKGAKDALEKGKYTVNWVLEDFAYWKKDQAANLVAPLIETGTPIDFIICNNDEMALGCIEAYNGNVTVPILGIDATKEGCKAVLSGDLVMTVNQDPGAQSIATIDCALGLINESLPSQVNSDSEYNMPAQTVTKEEAQGIMDALGN